MITFYNGFMIHVLVNLGMIWLFQHIHSIVNLDFWSKFIYI